MKLRVCALAALSVVLISAGRALAVPVQQADAPPGTVLLMVGDRLAFTFGADGKPVVSSRTPVAAADNADAPASPSRTTESLTEFAVHSRVSDQRLTAAFWRDADGAKLKLVNGYGVAIGYVAYLVFDHDGKRTYRETSVCPVRAGSMGMESWGDPMVGLAIGGFHAVDPSHMACSADSVLGESAAGADRFVCVGGETPGRLSPLTVTLLVDAAGAIQREEATWFLSNGDLAHAPGLLLDYGMEGRRIMPRPASIRVLAVVGLKPPPKSPTADIVLLEDGVEKARRPWEMYARTMATPPDPAKASAAFFGMIPFGPGAGGEGGGLAQLLGSVGDPSSIIEVRIAGVDGALLGDAVYPLGPPPDPAAVGTALDQALALAKTPTACRKITK